MKKANDGRIQGGQGPSGQAGDDAGVLATRTASGNRNGGRVSGAWALAGNPGGRAAGAAPARVSAAKYGNRRVMSHDGLKFDSVAELHRWRHLCMLQQHGLIADLRRQVAFELVRGVRFAGAARARPAIRYVADFVYTEKGVEVIEDVKGMETAEFKLKRHLMLALLGREIRVVK